MNILSVSILLVIVPYILLYRTMKPPTVLQLQQRTNSETVAEVELDMLVGHDTAEELGGRDDSRGKTDQFVSVENGGCGVESGSVVMSEESDKVWLLTSSSDNEEEEEEL